ncbi:MAG: hypothetical protein JNK29_16835 [Anaerolineales bacterium]|nr:hypothetical protein [Anaerolineales bacterium]
MALIRISIALYRGLLLAYPAAHRRTYGPLMLQLFRDLCREAGSAGLARLWGRTVPDLAVSLAAAHWEAAEEALMSLNRSVAPVAWGQVGLVVVPGLLFGLARVIGPLGWPAGLSFLLVALLALGGLVVRRRLPVWGLLALGLITGWAMQWLSVWLPGTLPLGLLGRRVPAAADLGVRLLTSPATQQAVVAFPLWLITFWLLWRHRQPGRLAAGALLVVGLAGVGAAFLVDGGTLLAAALVGLPLAWRWGCRWRAATVRSPRCSPWAP